MNMNKGRPRVEERTTRPGLAKELGREKEWVMTEGCEMMRASGFYLRDCKMVVDCVSFFLPYQKSRFRCCF